MLSFLTCLVLVLHLLRILFRRLALARDPDDNSFVQCADAVRADYLLIGNPRHFPELWKKTKVITSRDVIDIVAPHLLS